MNESGYVYGGAATDEELSRIRYVEAWADPLTIRQLEAIGVSSGWRCADVGAGGGSVARWLAERVGPSGAVIAADIDVRFLSDLPANVEVRTHDVVNDRLEPDSYDLVHCRALLLHLADPRGALVRMVSAVKPGGWLLAEDADWGLCTIAGHADAAWATGYLHDVWARHAREGIRYPYFGRRLPGLVAELGLDSVYGEVVAPITREGTTSHELIRLTVRALRQANIRVGASEHDLDRLESVLADPSIVLLGLASVSLRGRRSV